MGDRHGGCFARRGRALNTPRPQVDAHREVGFRWRATVFRCRGAVDRICPAGEHAPRRRHPDTARRRRDLCRAGTRPTAKASRHGARAKEFVPRENTPLGEGLPTRREGERICPAQERSPRRRPPDTAHERKDLPRVRRLPTAKASRHGARAKGFARARTLSSAKASRHGARAKGFAPRRNAPHGEGIPTRRTGEGICPAQERSPRRRPPDTAHERRDLPRTGTRPRRRPPDTARRRKDLCRAGTRPSTKASRHGAKAKGFAPRGFALAPRADERRAALNRRTARKTPLRRGRTHSARPLPSSFTEKK